MIEQCPVIKILVAKCRLCELYRGLCDVYGDICSKKIFTNEPNMRQSIEWKLIDSLVKKKFRVQRWIKMVMLTVFRNMKRPIIINFFEKVQL